jgi:hypothetical protein
MFEIGIGFSGLDISVIITKVRQASESVVSFFSVTPIPKETSTTQITREPPPPASSVLKGTLYLED